MKSVAERVLDIISGHLLLTAPVKLTERLADDLECDSLDLVEIALAIEDEFSVEIPEASYMFETAGDIVDWLNQQGITDG